ncbi:MAG: TetR/AcrR family transcriptional regulator C-terminal domain-containing protein, partial [Janthinobacterium lividum]
LSLFAARGEIVVADPEVAADLLLNLVLGRSMRRAAYGVEVDPAATEQRLRAAVELFLQGARPRNGQDQRLAPNPSRARPDR